MKLRTRLRSELAPRVRSQTENTAPNAKLLQLMTILGKITCAPARLARAYGPTRPRPNAPHSFAAFDYGLRFATRLSRHVVREAPVNV